jgi:hypothetical protein
VLTEDQKQLILEAEFSAVVLGRGEEFVIVRLQCNDDDTAGQEAIAQGMRYCGVLAVKDGIPTAEVESDPGAIYTMCFASLAFARMVVDRLHEPQPRGDAEEWLGRLFQIPDHRA